MYYPFVRQGLDKMHILWSAPFYLTYGIRNLVGWAMMLLMGLIVFIVGKHDQDP